LLTNRFALGQTGSLIQVQDDILMVMIVKSEFCNSDFKNMSTLSIPISPEQERFISRLVEQKIVPNKAEAVRKALRLLAEEEAIASILKSEQEISEGKILKEDIKKLIKKLS
jgi:Arc/MetJ-type ribon-helix-helix transcriptional regulator